MGVQIQCNSKVAEVGYDRSTLSSINLKLWVSSKKKVKEKEYCI